jgi:hypothetical protein
MKNISAQYQELKEGKMTQHQFLRNARMMFPNFVTNHNSFNDSVTILKTKGLLNEGDAVKGTPDKEPTYDSPTPEASVKYKKVEQSPEVDEQDGIYPATSVKDVPKKEKTYKKVKNTSDGLEPIKDNDTKNELKKVKVVKENISPEDIDQAEVEITTNDSTIQAMADKMGISQEELFKLLLKKLGGLKENSKKDEMNEGNDKSFEDVFKNFLDTDDATEIKAYVKEKGPAVLRLIRSKLNSLHGQARKKVADYLKVELDEAQWDYGTQIGTGKEDREEDTFEKIVARSNSFEDFEKEIQNQLSGRTNDIEGLRRVYNKYKGTKLGEARFKKGTDIGKPGSGFEKVAKTAEKEYGSKEAGQKVAGAILKKVLNKESINFDNLTKYSAADLKSLLDTKNQELKKLKSGTNIPPLVQGQIKKLGVEIGKIERELNRESSIKEKLRPAIQKLVQEVLDEMGQE